MRRTQPGPRTGVYPHVARWTPFLLGHLSSRLRRSPVFPFSCLTVVWALHSLAALWFFKEQIYEPLSLDRSKTIQGSGIAQALQGQIWSMQAYTPSLVLNPRISKGPSFHPFVMTLPTSSRTVHPHGCFGVKTMLALYKE